MSKRSRWVAVKVRDGNPKKWCEVAFALVYENKPNDFHWFGGAGHCDYAPGDYNIVETFGYGIYKESFEIEFRKRYRKPQTGKLEQHAGWISPTGHFYLCNPFGHDSVATNITAQLFNSLSGTRMLEEKGWIRVYEDGVNACPDKITQEQINTAFELSKNGDPEWKKYMKGLVKHND